MNSRTWLAISLACFIWFSYLKWFAPMPPQPVQSPITNTESTAPVEAAKTENKTTNVNATDLVVSSSVSHVENADLSVAFSPKGGRIAEIVLKNYKESIKKDAKNILPISQEHNGYSLATIFSETELNSLANGDFSLETTGKNVSFTSREVDGYRIKKSYQLAEAGHYIDATLTIQVSKAAKKNLGSLTVPIGGKNLEYAHEIPLKSWESVYLQDGKVHRAVLDKLPENEEIKQGTTNWIAFGNRYFAAALVNDSELNPDVALKKSKDFSGAYMRFPVALKDGQTELTYKFKIYAGPKNVTELSKVNGLKQLVDYGTFSFFAYPLLGILQFFYKFVHNYGIAIILLTLLVRALFYPLSVKSYKSMKAMQKLQPQIAVLKEKYKNDMTRMNQEQMALFKAHGVNPMGGCFPMLVQLPVFIALYAVLGNSIELFQAPFFGWVMDLSTKDPFYVYPVLMGIAMFLQQKMTPAVGMDPAQQKIMLFMPVIFSFMMVGLPAGLTLYIFVSTLLGILQQWSMMRDSTPRPTLAVAETSPKTK